MLSIVFAVLGSWLVLSLTFAIYSLASLPLFPLQTLLHKSRNSTVIGLASYYLSLIASAISGASVMFLIHSLCRYLEVVPSYGMLIPALPGAFAPFLDNARAALRLEEHRSTYSVTGDESAEGASFDGSANGGLLGTLIGLIGGAIYFLSEANLLLPERVG